MALRAVPDHPKFAELKARLRLPRYAVLGCLEAIWHFTGRYTPQGNIGKYSDEAIEDWVGWQGQSGELINALVDTRWIDRAEAHRLIVHDWHQHADVMVHTSLARDCALFANGVVPECGRLNQRERDRFHAWRESEGIAARPQGRPQSSQKEDDKQPISSHNAAEKQPDFSHNAAVAAGKAAKKPKPEPCLAGALPEPSSARSVPPEEPAATLPLVDGSSYPVSREQVDDWARAFPGIDVSTEITRAKVWFDANPTRKKTRKGINRSLVNWLGRAQDRSHGPNGGSNGRVEEPPQRPKTRYDTQVEEFEAERREAKRQAGIE